MYTQQDFDEVRGKLRKDLYFGIPALAAAIALYVVGIKEGSRWLVYGAAALIFIVFCFTWTMYLWPHIKYLNFLKNMQRGLSREAVGTINEIGETDEMQDGARVRSVHLLLDAEQDERILYMNAAKLERLPKAGSHIKVICYGRHIRDIQ